MKETPLLFKAPMVIATLEDRKTETRRLRGLELINENPDFWSVTWQGIEKTSGRFGVQFDGKRVAEFVRCPYGAPGDWLWVKETFYNPEGTVLAYRATSDSTLNVTWRPSIFMPRWASRITLEIVSVCVERLQDITKEGVISEGTPALWPNGEDRLDTPRIFDYQALWNSINLKTHPWKSNPWVWVIQFRRIKP